MKSAFVIILILSLCALKGAEARRSRRGRRRSTPSPSSTPPPTGDIKVFQGGCPLDFSALCSPWNPFGRLFQPDFLKGVSDDGFKDFCKIGNNNNLTKAELKDRLGAWARKQGGSIYDLFKKYMKDKQEENNKIYEKIKEYLKGVAEFFQKQRKIEENMNMTRKEESQKITNLRRTTNSSTLTLADHVRLEALFSMAGSSCPNCGEPCSDCTEVFPERAGSFESDMDGKWPFGRGGPFGERETFGNGPWGASGSNEDDYPFDRFGNGYANDRFF